VAGEERPDAAVRSTVRVVLTVSVHSRSRTG
jgi:hypothetical protein